MIRFPCVQSVLTVAVCFLPLTASAAGSEEQEKASKAASRIISVIDVVLENHFSPPVRQQLLLTGSIALHRSEMVRAQPPDEPLNQWLAPQGLGARVSKLSTDEEFRSYLTELFVQCEQIDEAERLFSNAMIAILPGGGRIIDAKSDRVEEQVRANRYVGIGIAIALNSDAGLPQIPQVFYDGPAWKAAIQSGDLIVEIDGRITAQKNLQRIVEELRGDDGSKLTVVVRQPDSDTTRTIHLTRGRVFIPTIEGHRKEANGKWIYVLEATDSIAYLRFTNIGPSTLHELRKLVTPLRHAGTRGVILDLRSGGGTLHDTVVVADSLLDGGLIGSAQAPSGTVVHEARPGTILGHMPMAVIVGAHTSGGNSFLAAALQDTGGAKLIGQTPRSAAFINSIVQLPAREDKLMVATGLLLRADGTPLLNGMFASFVVPNELPVDGNALHMTDRKIDRRLLRPDYEVVPNATGDQELGKAIEVLKNEIESAAVRR